MSLKKLKEICAIKKDKEQKQKKQNNKERFGTRTGSAGQHLQKENNKDNEAAATTNTTAGRYTLTQITKEILKYVNVIEEIE